MARSRPRSFTCRLRRREIFGRFGKKREVTAATNSFFFSSLSSLFSTSFAEWSSTYCRPSRRDINVVVTIGLLLQNGWLQKALRARDHFEREKMILFWFRICVLLLYCRDDNSVNPARFEPRLWRRLVPNLHDFYDWAIVLICAILCVFVFVSSSRCLGVLADIFYSSSVFIFCIIIIIDNRAIRTGSYLVYIYVSILRVRGKNAAFILSLCVCVCFCSLCESGSMCASSRQSLLKLFYMDIIKIAKGYQGNEDFSFPNWSTLKRNRSARSPPSNSCQN